MKVFVKMIVILLVLCVSLGMVACGGTNVDDSELTIGYKAENSEQILTKQLCKAFEEKMSLKGKSVKTKLVSINSGSYNAEIDKAYNAGTLCDVMYVTDEYASVWSENGVFEDLTPYFSNDNFDFSLYDDAAFESAKAWQNKIAYAPRSYDQFVVYLNLDFFAEYNVDIPSAENWTWTKLFEVCDELRQKIVAKYGSGNADYYRPIDCEITWQPLYYSMIKAFGGYIIDLQTNSVGLNQTAAINAIKKLNEMADKKYCPNPGSGSNYFPNGRSAMYIMTRASCANLTKNDITNVAFLPFPEYDSAFTGVDEGKAFLPYGSTGYAITSTSKKKDVAYEFIKFTLSEEGQSLMGNNGSIVPVLKSLQNNPNASWCNKIDCLKGVDQTAFVFSSSLANNYVPLFSCFGRGFNPPAKERTLYDSLKQSLLSMNSSTYADNNMDKFAEDMANRLKRDLGI